MIRRRWVDLAVPVILLTELDMGPAGGEAQEAAQESFPDDLDQTPQFDPGEPDPLPQEDFDQSWRA